MKASFKVTYFILSLISPFSITTGASTTATTQKVLTNEQWLGDVRQQIDVLEAEYWVYSPQFHGWENTTTGQIESVLDKLTETAREKIRKLKAASGRKTSAQTTHFARFHKWVYMLVNTMEPRIAFLRNKLGNFRRMCSFSANIAYLRQTLDKYPYHRHVPPNSTLKLEPSDIQNIRTALKTDLNVDDEAIEDVTLLFGQVEEIRKDCLDD